MAAPKGSKHHKAKLTDKAVKAIRKACDDAFAAGFRRPLSALAEKYGVGRSAIAAVADRRTWTHVEQA